MAGLAELDVAGVERGAVTDHLSEMMAKADHWHLEALRLRALINATADCPPGCDSAGHVEDCTNGDPLADDTRLATFFAAHPLLC